MPSSYEMRRCLRKTLNILSMVPSTPMRMRTTLVLSTQIFWCNLSSAYFGSFKISYITTCWSSRTVIPLMKHYYHCYYYYYYSFSRQLTLIVFHWSLCDSKSPQVSRTLLSILAVLNNSVVWMVFTRLPTSKSSSPFSNPLVTIPKAPITIATIFHQHVP